MSIRPDTFSLRIKIVLLILAPLLVAFSLLSFIHYFSGRNLLMENRLASSARLGDMLLRSMRHSMLANNTAELDEALLDVTTLGANNHALILDANNTIKHSSKPEEAGTILTPTTDSDCRDCHREPPEKRPRVMMTGVVESKAVP